MNGCYRITLRGSREYESRTQVLSNGDSLRIISDVTDRMAREQHLEFLALHDPLTGLPNRAFFDREFATRLERVKGTTASLVLMLIDLDRIKQVNDEFGHPAGDALLVEVSRRMKVAGRRSDFDARIGGDEFAMLILDEAGDTDESAAARRVIESISRPIAYQGYAFVPGATIGIARAGSGAESPASLLVEADGALYTAKAAGRGIWRVYGASAISRRA